MSRWTSIRWRTFALLLLGAGVLYGCDFLDPTGVENPRTTLDDLSEATNPTAAMMPGLRAQMARLVASGVIVTAIVSDDYSLENASLANEWDSPRMVTPTLMNATDVITGLYWNAQELRALATFVLETIAPGDPTASPTELADAHYYRGMAYLYLGENFSAAPTEQGGDAVGADRLLGLAIEDLGRASGLGPAVDAALARAHRWTGDRTSAGAAASAALEADPGFVFLQDFDPTSIENTPHAFLVARGFQELQPLPRLDFLDPKYLTRGQGIAVAKAEEMHLILAEIALASDDLEGARTALRDAIELARSRTTNEFDDRDQRLNEDLSIRPRDAVIDIRADASSAYRSGLVLSRPGVVTQHVLSGTSLDPDSVVTLVSDDELWHALHLARQEILFLEGRRMADLGIRLPMMATEIDTNRTIEPGDPGTTVVVPSYIPSGDGMDRFSPMSPYDPEETLVTTQVTIDFDMNRVLATNRVTPFAR